MVKQKKTVESMVADAVMQKPLGTITIDGVDYIIDRPRIGTLILVSELISQLPKVNNADNENDNINEALRVAKDCRILAEIAAVLILGVKRLTEEITTEHYRLFGIIKTHTTETIDLKKELADKLIDELSPTDLQALIVECLLNQQLMVFFGVITSLYEVNLLKPTSEVKTTASGQ